MIFNNKLKVVKERRSIVLKVIKLSIFLFLISGLTSIAIVQKLQLKSKQNHISILLEDNQKILCDAENAIDSLKVVNKNITNRVKQKVVATMYHAVVGQCDDTPDITADQTKIPDIHNCTNLNWIAVSQDLLWFNGGPYRYGDKVIIMNAGHKDGIYTIRDAMNRRFKHKIDFLESVGSKGYKFKNVLMVKVTQS
jgi:hypothetical protein|tara:strand:+ start:44 stop:628 length:585 start_codon:yes stop_codon:yes gene_type:complete